MNWNDQLDHYERQFNTGASTDWMPAVLLAEGLYSAHQEDMEASIRILYFLHHIALEEQSSEQVRSRIAAILPEMFDRSQIRFSSFAIYLFYIGLRLHVAEWYFGHIEKADQIEDQLAFKMQKRAFDLEPSNLLFEWGSKSAYADGPKALEASSLARQALQENSQVRLRLEQRGFPGKYVLEHLKMHARKVWPE